MKTAQVKYTHSNGELNVGIYFDNKAFEFIVPPMSKEEEDEFIRVIGDSLAAVCPKDARENNYFIKRAVKYFNNNTLKLLCCDGFLIDIALILPISQQAFAKERIKITEIESIPSRLKFGPEAMKNINDRLPLYEEQVRRDAALTTNTTIKEEAKQEKEVFTLRDFATDKATDILVEISNLKRDVKDISESNIRALKSLSTQVDTVRDRIFDVVMIETKSTLQYEDNKKRLDDFARVSISQYGGGDVSKHKEILRKKIEEITPISKKFDTEIDAMSQRIVKQTSTLTQFKQLLINALYLSARQFADELKKQMQTADAYNKKNMLTEFNKKFAGITTMSPNGELTPITAALDKLIRLSFEDLQMVISNEDKENPGILQKCNTSWVDESPELQIVMRNLTQLNESIGQLFVDNPQYPEYAKSEMVQLIRIPFPRSFQFKFSPKAYAYKKSVDDFCRAEKETIINLSQEFKRTIQIDAIRDNTQRAIVDIQRQTETMRKPVSDFRDLLKRKESSGDIIALAGHDHDLTNKTEKEARSLLEAINTKTDINFKMLRRKTSTLVQEILDKAADGHRIMQNMNEAKSQIDSAINTFQNKPTNKPNLNELDAKIKSLSENRNILIEQNKTLEELRSKLDAYQHGVAVSDNITLAIAQSNMRKQHTEAKTFLLQLIKNQTLDPKSSEELKKHMIGLFTNIDNNIATVDKHSQELAEMRTHLFESMNSKGDITTSELKGDVDLITEKLATIEQARDAVGDSLSTLRKLALGSAKERKQAQ